MVVAKYELISPAELLSGHAETLLPGLIGTNPLLGKWPLSFSFTWEIHRFLFNYYYPFVCEHAFWIFLVSWSGVPNHFFFRFCGKNLCANPSGYIPVISCTRSLAAPSIFFLRLKPGTIQYYIGLNYICSIQLNTCIYI